MLHLQLGQVALGHVVALVQQDGSTVVAELSDAFLAGVEGVASLLEASGSMLALFVLLGQVDLASAAVGENGALDGRRNASLPCETGAEFVLIHVLSDF